MSVKLEWQEDSEAMTIATELIEKVSDTLDEFNGIDPSKIRFIRIMGRPNGKPQKVTSVGFPFNIDITSYLYYIEIDDEQWKKMDEAHRVATVLEALMEIAPGGMDPQSANYGKKRKKDFNGYRIVIDLLDGRYDWNLPGSTGVRNILDENDRGNGGGNGIGSMTEEDKNNLDSLLS